MKIGDKLVCRMNYDKPDLVKGQIYEICDIEDRSIKFDINGIWSFGKSFIWEYFYTPQETRKMKLEKLYAENGG